MWYGAVVRGMAFAGVFLLWLLMLVRNRNPSYDLQVMTARSRLEPTPTCKMASQCYQAVGKSAVT